MSFALQNVSLRRDNGALTLAGIHLAAAAGEQIALIGPSGAGKTTLLQVLAAGLQPTEGRVLRLGSPAALPGRALRSRIGLIHQAAPLPDRQRVVTAVLAGRLGRWPWWKSLASLIYPLDIAGAHALLEQLGLGDKLFARCGELSGGQRQRVGIARVLYQGADLMLADEPVSSLDPALADSSLQRLVDESQARGATLIASLHAVDLALAHFPRIVGLVAGRVVFDLPRAAVDEGVLRALYAGSLESPEPLRSRCPITLADPAARLPCC